ncbi:uncharacterized protein LOC129650951 [Bubalus kerabau]|uniref:uncharacterized protein LOC129650951 n=1 Tax=Bubalus carabanensis TaxID=3119969 RepID=UPI00244E7853|nr:uncharacterized protein LOC129650951 [Bubalus carabanensis]
MIKGDSLTPKIHTRNKQAEQLSNAAEVKAKSSVNKTGKPTWAVFWRSQAGQRFTETKGRLCRCVRSRNRKRDRILAILRPKETDSVILLKKVKKILELHIAQISQWTLSSKAPQNTRLPLIPSQQGGGRINSGGLEVPAPSVALTEQLNTYAHPTTAKRGAHFSLSLQSCPTLCDPIDGSPPGSPVPGILQARTLEEGRKYQITALINGSEILCLLPHLEIFCPCLNLILALGWDILMILSAFNKKASDVK